MRIITLNLNGIRSAERKGFFHWLQKQNADVVCLQEIKAQEEQLLQPLFALEGYHAEFHCAEKKGYSGVGIYSRYKPLAIVKGLGWEVADAEGRYVAMDLGPLWVASIYMPSGTMGAARQALKMDFLSKYTNYLRSNILAAPQMIICGDINIAHKPIDLKNWRANQKNTGFLPEERAWLDELFSTQGFVDAFRVINSEPDQYTWWSNRGNARANNVGWRIDYQIVTKNLSHTIKSASIYTKERFSDHAPLCIDYNIDIH